MKFTLNSSKKKLLFFYNLFIFIIISSSALYYLLSKSGLKNRHRLEAKLFLINEKIKSIGKKNFELKKEIELFEKYNYVKELIAKDKLDLLKKEETMFILN